MYPSHPLVRLKTATILAPEDLLRRAIWIVAFSLAAVAGLLHPTRIVAAAAGTAEPFLTLAGVIAAGMAAERIGAFRALARVLIPPRLGPRLSAVAVLAFTALLSGIVNLDIAVIVAIPLAIRVASSRRLRAGALALAAALTANATSFLLPTSNLTSLLVLTRSPLPAPTYLSQSWVAWLLVSGLTVGVLALVTSGRPAAPTGGLSDPGVSRLPMLADLIPMFVAASAIRSLLGTGFVLGGGFVKELAIGCLLAAGVNNLPAAAAVQSAGPSGRWAMLLAMALGPNLVLTGSVASLISRRLARDRQARFSVLRFTLLGALLLPAQLLVAWVGLELTGGVH